MDTTFLEYSKMVIEKVSFDQYLFTREYCKAIKILTAEEIMDLNLWLASKGTPPHDAEKVRHIPRIDFENSLRV